MNGPTFGEFFNPKNRPLVLDLYTFDDTPQGALDKLEFADLFQRIAVILRVINSRDLVEVDEFRTYCTQTHIMFNKLFHWILDNETMHAVLGGFFDCEITLLLVFCFKNCSDLL